jgi:hypothetical protein
MVLCNAEEIKEAELCLHHTKKTIYASTHHFACTCCCRSYSLADQYLHTDGSQDQKHFECCGCDPYCYLAAAGIWPFGFDKEDKCVAV